MIKTVNKIALIGATSRKEKYGNIIFRDLINETNDMMGNKFTVKVQAVAFNDAVGIDGIILSKADIDDKGGAAISVSFVTKKPILYLGVGQTYDDLKPFDKDEILDSLGL